MSDDEFTDDDRRRLGFALSAYGAGAITAEEMARWVLQEVTRLREPPIILIELLDVGKLGDRLTELKRTEGRDIYHDVSTGQFYALMGIGYKRRGVNPGYDPAVSEAQAYKRMERHPEVIERFRREFPEVEY